MKYTFTAVISRGLEEILQKELRRLQLQNVVVEQGAVRFQGNYKAGLKACLWSRTASRVFLRLHRFNARNEQELYEGVQHVDWAEHLRPSGTLWIDFVGYSKALKHSVYSARRVKDAIVDQLRDKYGQRPSVQKESPDMRLQVHLKHGVVTLNLDLCGAPLHLRTPNKMVLDAPLKETLAAALLIKSNWYAHAQKHQPFFDPMCGSGTLIAEAASIAGNIAPNLHRKQWAFSRWLQHKPKAWSTLVEEAHALQTPIHSPFFGADIHPQAMQLCRKNLKKCGLSIPELSLKTGSFFFLSPPTTASGFLFANPPYGERLDIGSDLALFYKKLSDKLRQEYLGWHVFVLSTPACAKHIALKSKSRFPVFNGNLHCRLLEYPIALEPPQRFRSNS